MRSQIGTDVLQHEHKKLEPATMRKAKCKLPKLPARFVVPTGAANSSAVNYR